MVTEWGLELVEEWEAESDPRREESLGRVWVEGMVQPWWVLELVDGLVLEWVEVWETLLARALVLE